MIAASRALILALMVLSATGAGAQDLYYGLIGCYSFSGDAKDGSGHHQDGIVTGATLTTDRFGNPNSAYQFGTGKYITLESDSVPIEHWSYSVWVNIAAFPALPPDYSVVDKFIISSEKYTYYRALVASTEISTEGLVGYMFRCYTGTGVLLSAWGGPGRRYDVAPTNQWIHLVGTSEGDYPRLYVNGVITDTTNWRPGYPQVYQHLKTYIGDGHTMSDPNVNLDVVIDDLAIYDRVLTQAEINLLYEVGLPCSVDYFQVSAAYKCGTDSATLSAGNGSNYRWYDAAAGGTLLLDGNPLKVNVTATTTYYVAKVTNGIDGFRLKYTISPMLPLHVTSSGPAEEVIETPVVFSASNDYRTGSAPFHYAFDFGDGTQVDVNTAFVSHSYSATGNYTMTVTVTDANRCSSQSSQTVRITPMPPQADQQHICPGSTATIVAFGGTTYRWYTADGTLLSRQNSLTTPILLHDTTFYVAVVSNSIESTKTKVEVDVYPSPQVICEGAAEAIAGYTTEITTRTTVGPKPYHYAFEINGVPQQGAGPDLNFKNAEPGHYDITVIVTDANGCKGSCEHEVDMLETFIPNVITVNRDSINERFTIFEKLGDHYEPYSGPIEFSMKIMNRYGQEVYTTRDPIHGWNGSNFDPGVYYYDITFGSERLKGWVSVTN